jgi:hypothetical protein
MIREARYDRRDVYRVLREGAEWRDQDWLAGSTNR